MVTVNDDDRSSGICEVYWWLVLPSVAPPPWRCRSIQKLSQHNKRLVVWGEILYKNPYCLAHGDDPNGYYIGTLMIVVGPTFSYAASRFVRYKPMSLRARCCSMFTHRPAEHDDDGFILSASDGDWPFPWRSCRKPVHPLNYKYLFVHLFIATG